MLEYNDIINIYNYDLKSHHGDNVLSGDEIKIRDYLVNLYPRNIEQSKLTIRKVKTKLDNDFPGIPAGLALNLMEE